MEEADDVIPSKDSTGAAEAVAPAAANGSADRSFTYDVVIPSGQTRTKHFANKTLTRPFDPLARKEMVCCWLKLPGILDPTLVPIGGHREFTELAALGGLLLSDGDETRQELLARSITLSIDTSAKANNNDGP